MFTDRPADRLRADRDSEESESSDPPDDDPRSLLPRWLPDPQADQGGTLQGWLATVRADPGRAGGVALAVVAVLAVLVTVFTLIRDQPDPVVSAKLPPVQMVSSAAVPTASGSAAPDQPVVVSVVGLVQKPGLVTMTPGARVADAISAAGGTTGGADTLGLNMARQVADGEQVVVGIAPIPGAPPTLGSSITGSTDSASGTAPGTSAATEPGSGPTAGPLDLNSATAAQLDELPGVGPVTAAAIVSWREQHGPFGSVDQLGEVDGIGPARLQKLRDLVRV